MPLISPEAVLQGDRLALSRLLTQLENQKPEGQKVLDALYPVTGQAYLVGITGAPGTGKSSLVNRLVQIFRQPAQDSQTPKVGIIAVDPSSPFSGGAVLGDRVRMGNANGDPGVFIRSMASRGSLGGLAATTSQLVQALDAAGYQLILIETVGAGQAEVEIARLAHSTVVVEAPGLGDEIQTIKAGILEIADILVVNKSDLPGAEQAYRALVQMLTGSTPDSHHNLKKSSNTNQDPEQTGWEIPVLMTSAVQNEGVADLKNALLEHRKHLKSSGYYKLREIRRIQADLDRKLQNKLVALWREQIQEDIYQRTLSDLIERRITPDQALQKLLRDGGIL
jgi:LAO/AO transport system kinase